MENSISLKSINEIRKADFIVPSYQRGYRWTNKQVQDLLDDIWEFYPKRKSEEEFYCLQPVIVKGKGQSWEVVDGQQRLTTIYLILEAIKKKNYTISFDTRSESAAFLKDLKDTIDDSNIDFYYLSSAYKTIREWFEKRRSDDDDYSMEDRFNIALGTHTKIIWYQLNDSSDPRGVFTRINIGKIPLTNAELIKALFLRRENFGTEEEWIRLRQIEIASDWDRIESDLQDDAFWYFINKGHNSQLTRIEFLFDLIAEKEPGGDENFTFHFYHDHFANKKESIDEIWKEVKDCFLTLRGWFEDKDLYHLVGYLIAIGADISQLKRESKGRSKSNFKSFLRKQIKSNVNYDLEDLQFGYYNPNKAIEKILLLFNIETILQNEHSGARFPFDQYKGKTIGSTGWSLEHIHAQKSRGLDTTERRKSWLQEALSVIESHSIEAKELIKEIQGLIGKVIIDRNEFDSVQEKVVSLFGEPDLHTIDNLTLLSISDNSSLNNSIFPVKREKVIELEKLGSFIPICTRNVFLKYYTPNPSHLHFWAEDDRRHYLNAIKKVLKDYLTP